MFKRTITYEDFDGEKVSETFYFNLSKAELIELEVEYEKGFSSFLERIIETNDRKELIKQFKAIVLMAYGQKSEDGKRFVKNEKLREEFASTAAYSQLFEELAIDDGKASEFLIGCMPKELGDEISKKELQDKTAAALTSVPSPPPNE